MTAVVDYIQYLPTFECSLALMTMVMMMLLLLAVVVVINDIGRYTFSLTNHQSLDKWEVLGESTTTALWMIRKAMITEIVMVDGVA